MNDFTIYGSSFDACLESLSRVLNRCVETNLVINFEKCHFMVTKGIVLGHLVSSKGIEVDKAKIDIISSLPYSHQCRKFVLFLDMQVSIRGSFRTSAKLHLLDQEFEDLKISLRILLVFTILQCQINSIDVAFVLDVLDKA